MSVTDGDRAKGLDVLMANQPEDVAEAIAAALAAEREKARAPFLALADAWSSLCIGVPARGSYDNGLYVGLLKAARELRATLAAAQ